MFLKGLAARVRWLGLAVFLASCPPVPDDDAGTDGGVDARDAGLDSAPRDVPRDVPPDAPPDPVWRAVALDAPPWCSIESSGRPGDVHVSEWSPCLGDLPGCTQLADSPLLGEQYFGDGVAGWHDGVGYFGIVADASLDGPTVVVVAASDGPARAAWRGQGSFAPGGCLVMRPAVAPPTLGVVYWWLADEPLMGRDMLRLGDMASPIGVEPAVFASDGIYPAGNVAQHLVTSTTTAAFQVGPIGYIIVAEPDRWARRSGPTGVVTGGLGELFVHEHDVFFTSWYEGPSADDVWLSHTTVDREEHAIYHATGRLRSPGTDGSELCWVRLGTAGTTAGDLECVAYTTEAEIAPRVVRADVPAAGGMMGPGLYATLGNTPSLDAFWIDVIDLGTGALRRYELGASYRFSERPFWVTSDEVAVPVVVAATGRRTVFRIQLSAFEPVP